MGFPLVCLIKYIEEQLRYTMLNNNIIILTYIFLTRWRNSFFFSLIFGIPVMIVMIVFMSMMSHGGGGVVPPVNGTNDSSHPPAHHGILVVPGLSLENLLLFLLCTPCLVSSLTFLMN